MQDYNKNLKPVVKTPMSASPIKQKNENLAPVVATSNSMPFSKSVMPKNSVTNSTSARLQSANRLSGRVNMKDMPSITFE